MGVTITLVSNEISELFLSELKKYNSTNFRAFERADLSVEDPKVFKSCSSVITRFFIFSERHPEIPVQDLKIMYYQLNIDRIAKYFADYPSASYEDLVPFQAELQKFARMRRGENIATN